MVSSVGGIPGSPVKFITVQCFVLLMAETLEILHPSV